MGEFINTIDIIGDSAAAAVIIDRTVTEFYDDSIKEIGDYAFYYCTLLTEVGFENVMRVESNAFRNCTSLITAGFPSATYIGNNAFEYCSMLNSVHCPSIKSVGSNSFSSCAKLKSIDFPLITNIGQSSFNNCKALVSVNLPLATTIGSNSFQSCSSLTNVKLPSIKKVDNWLFKNCTALVSVDLPMATSLTYGAFEGCTKLAALILRSETIASNDGGNVFSSTPIASGAGYIYVPRALVDSYRANSKWITYTNQFRVLEDHTVDGTITGELNPILLRSPMELTDDWSTIMTSANDGTYNGKYKVGDWKPLNLGAEGTVNMQIVAMDRDTLASGTGTAAVTWLAKEILLNTRRFNPALVAHYSYPELDAWINTGDNKWKSNNYYTADDAEATWIITAETDGEINVTSNSSYTGDSLGVSTIIVNDETLVDNGQIIGSLKRTVSVNVGDTVNVYALHRTFKESSGVSVTINFSGTATFTVDANVGKTTSRVADYYEESTGNIGGWEKSELRTYLNDTLKADIPSAITNEIVSVQKKYHNYDTLGVYSLQTSMDDLWIPSTDFEIGSSNGLYAATHPSKSSLVFYTQAGKVTTWWTRDFSDSSVVYDKMIYGSSSSTSSNLYSGATTDKRGILIGFCTGVTK